MRKDLALLARRYGVETQYKDASGEICVVPEETIAFVLDALGARADDNAAPGASAAKPEKASRCFAPSWLRSGKAWGVSLQLYQLRTDRDWGIGDFAALADYAKMASEDSADFVGVNPLHALFLSAPERCSPFFPSDRRFLNPLYIAPDLVAGFETSFADDAALAHVRGCNHVDYPAVARLKRTALEKIWRRWREGCAGSEMRAFDHFCEAEGAALRRYALFEALSEKLAPQFGAGWRGWPEDYRRPENAAVEKYSEEESNLVRFHAWLQFIADRQLAAAQEAACAAGMRIGLYLDLAVGEAPDGAAAWADQEATIPTLHVGAPPDFFSESGQDWGLAPLSPKVLRNSLEPFRNMIARASRHAGALRIDHAMALRRLFVVPQGKSPREGTYLVYPMEEMMEALASVSKKQRAIIIGEDLGVVPDGFRQAMARHELHAYRVLYFDEALQKPEAVKRVPRKSLACLSTHDLPPLAGWWRGDDIERRLDYGFVSTDEAETEQTRRAADREALLKATGRRAGEEIRDESALFAYIHAYYATSPARLFAVRLEDLAGERDPVNVPGTMDEYANWRTRFAQPVDALAAGERYRKIIAAVARTRPRPS